MAWIELVIGALVLLSPWMLGVSEMAIAWTNAALGGTLVLVSLWNIFVHRSGKNNI